jgi:hypothetical protein
MPDICPKISALFGKLLPLVNLVWPALLDRRSEFGTRGCR